MDILNKILPFFPKAFIHKEDELIIEAKNNVYFRTTDIASELDFDCKILEYVSRAACIGLSNAWQSYFRRGVNSYFRKNWSKKDMIKIYTYLGRGVDRVLCIKFIESGFDLSILKRY